MIFRTPGESLVKLGTTEDDKSRAGHPGYTTGALTTQPHFFRFSVCQPFKSTALLPPNLSANNSAFPMYYHQPVFSVYSHYAYNNQLVSCMRSLDYQFVRLQYDRHSYQNKYVRWDCSNNISGSIYEDTKHGEVLMQSFSRLHGLVQSRLLLLEILNYD